MSGTLFIGMDFGPELTILGGEAVNVSAKMKIGVEATITKVLSGGDPTKYHKCGLCFSIDAAIVIEMGCELTLFGHGYVGTTGKIKPCKGKFYWSIDHNEFGEGTCPYYTTIAGDCSEDSEDGFNNVKWKLLNDNTLYIYGRGDMQHWDFGSSDDKNRSPFHNNSLIKNCVIENGIYNISEDCFSGCSGLTSITIPDSVMDIGDYAFEGCISLKSITIPKRINTIYEGTFAGCQSLKNIIIPNSVKNICMNAFASCTSLTSIIIPDSVTLIDYCMFYDCENLRSITIPRSVKVIRSYAFYNCHNLTDVYYTGSKDE